MEEVKKEKQVLTRKRGVDHDMFFYKQCFF